MTRTRALAAAYDARIKEIEDITFLRREILAIRQNNKGTAT